MTAQPERTIPIVIIGASSGGIEAVSRLVEHLPADFPAPVLIVQHLSPDHSSHLSSILSKRSSIKVREVEDHAVLESGVIYVIPASRTVNFSDSQIRVRDSGEERPTPSIDRALESAANVYGERVIAVILTGSGSDGTAGASAVKEQDGTVIIQDPETAEYPSMPRSLAPSCVDFVRDLDQIGELLVELVNRPAVTSSAVDGDVDEDKLDAFLRHLREESSIDFSQYKPPTIMRRLQRRMVATSCGTLDEYRAYLRDNPDEYFSLINSFLIKVTEFFRDPELFDHLQSTIIPELIRQGSEKGNQIRVWSAGSATGEEAYSLAIQIAEALGNQVNRFAVQIFATDIDESSVNFARRGVYSSAALRSVPEDIKDRYFSSTDGEYEISKQIRSMVVFGQHDLAQRSPFPNIDLILCRNVLIYFTRDLQRRALQLFAYSLRNGGYLVLGKSESTSPLNGYFTAVENRLKIFQRHGELTPVPVGPFDSRIYSMPRAQSASSWSGSSLALGHRARRDAERSRAGLDRSEGLLYRLPVGVVVVDRNYDIRSLNYMARHYLGIHGPAIGEDLLHLIQTMPLETLRDSIDQAFRRRELVKVEGDWEIETVDGETLHVEIACQLQEGDRTNAGDQTVVIVLTDITYEVNERQRVAVELEAVRSEHHKLTDRVAQLFRINQQLVESNRELAESNEELRTDNQELMVSNEEAQASAEEIETLNEELQTTNEELETLNEELQATVEELNATNEDMQARTLELQEERMLSEAERVRLQTVLVSMGDAVLLVDQQGQVVLMNDACREMFGEDIAQLNPEDDNGEPLPHEERPIVRAARQQPFTMQFTVRTSGQERRWYEASGRPLREGEESPASVVVIRDITDRSLRLLQEEFMSVAGHELRTPLTALHGYLEMLQQRLSNGDERAQRYISISLEMVNRLVTLISVLLDVGRLQSGKFELSLENVDLTALTQSTVEMSQSTAPEHTIDLHAPEEPIEATIDPMRLQQVLLNLLANAVRYSPEADRVIVQFAVEDDHALISVQDFGVGLTPEAASQVFSRFYQGDTVKVIGPQRGLGLGLYISKQIVDAHGGETWVESEPGEGATFWVRFPLHRTEPERTASVS